MLRNKKGDNKYLSLWWFFCLVLVLVGFLIATYTYRASVNIAYLDSEILTSKVLDCVLERGDLSFKVSELNNLELSKCGIELRNTKNLELRKDYFLGIEIYGLDECEEIGEAENYTLCSNVTKKYFEPEQGYGLGNLKERCIRLEGVDVGQMPDCSYKIAYFDQDDKDYALRIIGGTNEN